MNPDELKQFRTELGLTQAAFAKRLGLSDKAGRNTLAAWESGDRDMPELTKKALNLLHAAHVSFFGVEK